MTMLNSLKGKIRIQIIKFQCFFFTFFNQLGIYKPKNNTVQFISEKKNWAIKRFGFKLKEEISKKDPFLIGTSNKPYLMVDNLLHFGSQYMWLSYCNYISKKNNIFVTSFFHGKPSDGPEVEKHINDFLLSIDLLSKVVTSCSIVEDRLKRFGVPKNKLITIPIGVDTKLFTPTKKDLKRSIRKKLGVHDDTLLIGSFQKDGIGWGEGNSPKLIKGPDLFIETLKILKKKDLKVCALLTGPARGYVKQGLKENDIPFIHNFVKEKKELVNLYRSLDVYLITSREEGGPMGLMESMSSGIPIISTKVGMANDLIIDFENGFISNSISSESIVEKFESFLNIDENQKKQIVSNARKTVESCDWQIVAKKHMELIYKPLILKK